MLLEKGEIKMYTERIKLSMKEERLKQIFEKLKSGKISNKQALALSQLSERQYYRKKKLYFELGEKSLPHKSRNRSTGRGYSNELKNRIIKLYLEEYNGWNFYHFNDALEDFHKIKVSDTFIYILLTSNNIFPPNRYKTSKNTHPPRERREYAGELIQVDASKHKWFYGDDNYYYLHGGIDDSTGIVTSCFFAEQETIFGYQMIMKETLINYGIPECLYTDYRTVFKSNKKELTIEEELAGKQIKNTRFANMLEHIGTDIISTMSPQAKGKIERLWRTFQDRLYKELKKNHINNIEEANQYLSNVFLPKYNARFALQIDNNKNHFICLEEDFDFNKELAVWSEHKVFHNSYLKYDKQYHIILKNNEKVYLPTSGNVKVYTFLDGTKHILFNEEYYDLKTVNDYKLEIKSLSTKNKTIKQINLSKAHKPTNSPWKKGLPPMPSYNSTAYAYFHGC